ncbi:MAG TPA: long-chain-fatty-acid--CoA ligase [Planctomycetota bacterium]|nr:long-chain-fatty-acid--CoA ligase [Planctomycetota bacterium]
MRIPDLLRRSAELHGSLEAIADARRSLTFRELEEDALRLAGGLAARGVSAGDRVAVLAKNRWETIALQFATSELGAVLVPLNWRLRAAELRAIAADAQAVAIAASEEFADAIAAHRADLPGVRLWIALDGAPGWLPFEELLRERARRDGEESVAAIQMYTSGTTGVPRGALLTHRNVTAMVASWRLELPLAPGDRFLQVTPLFHVGGMLLATTSLAAGSRLLLHPEFDPGSAARALANEGVTHALLVPSMVQWIVSERGPTQQQRPFPALKTIVYGAAPMPVALLVRVMEEWGCDFLQGYGLTETCGVLTALRPEDHRFDPRATPPRRLASAGREVSCCEVRVVDGDGRDVGPDEVGEIVARGDNVTPGYWRMPEATAEAFRDGWLRTGDLATVDDDGFVYVVDRLKDMILVGGENVYPREIEDVLLRHGSVADAAVIGAPHPVWGEEVVAIVAARPGAALSDREVIRHCRERLARFKCPTRVEVRDAIPRSAAGKIEKRALREPYWAGRDRRV